MSTRQKGGQSTKKAATPSPTSVNAVKDDFQPLQYPAKSATSSEWDYKLALFIITAIAFVTRFWGINHPNEVVFDEVHFGKVPSPGPRRARPPQKQEKTLSDQKRLTND